MSISNINERKRARMIAMQALYQWLMSGGELHAIELQYLEHNDPNKVDIFYFKELLYGIPKCLEEIEQLLSKNTDRALKELSPVELTVLRLATYELIKRLDVPYKVVINEALTLAKRFGTSHGHLYVNGVLDQIARETRSIEFNSSSK